MASTAMLRRRADLFQAVRRFFVERDYLEVDTPLLLPALVPEAYIEPVTAGPFFLQTSPELCMKRLLARGVPALFQICKCFRHGERGRLHLPEFTMLEWYRAGADYRDLMDDCIALLQALDSQIGTGQGVVHNGQQVRFAAPWERLTVAEAFARYAQIQLDEALAADQFEELLVSRVEPRLGVGRPTFLYDFPASLGSLARLKPTDGRVAERFELYVAGLELANGFSELTDADEQCHRFLAERQKIKEQGREPGPMPEKFLAELGGMPESAGIALGLDRLLLLFSNGSAIDDVVAFVPEDL